MLVRCFKHKINYPYMIYIKNIQQKKSKNNNKRFLATRTLKTDLHQQGTRKYTTKLAWWPEKLTSTRTSTYININIYLEYWSSQKMVGDRLCNNSSDVVIYYIWNEVCLTKPTFRINIPCINTYQNKNGLGTSIWKLPQNGYTKLFWKAGYLDFFFLVKRQDICWYTTS